MGLGGVSTGETAAFCAGSKVTSRSNDCRIGLGGVAEGVALIGLGGTAASRRNPAGVHGSVGWQTLASEKPSSSTGMIGFGGVSAMPVTPYVIRSVGYGGPETVAETTA